MVLTLFLNPFFFAVVSGIYPYRAQISGTRLVILSCMTELSVDVLKITKHPNEGAIKVRWRIKGIPMIRKLASHITRRVKASEDGYRYLNHFFTLVPKLMNQLSTLPYSAQNQN